VNVTLTMRGKRGLKEFFLHMRINAQQFI